MAVNNINVTGIPGLESREIPQQKAAVFVASRSATIALIALWFALLTGLAETSLLAFAKFFLNRYIHYFGRDFVWMAPLAQVFLFAIAVAFVLVLKGLRPKLIPVRLLLFGFAFLSYINLLMIYQGLHRIAVVLLAVGLAIQTARFLSAHIDGFYRLIQRTTIWIVVLILLLGLGIWGGWYVAEQRVLANLPPARPNAPNVLWIVMDTVRAQNLSLYGYKRRTSPELEKLAKNGVVFEQAISTAPWTLPSHASMFTGRYPSELSVGFTSRLDAKYPTLAEALSANGYLTAGFVANTWYCGSASGLSRGFTHYEDLPVSLEQVLISSMIVRAANGNPRLRRLVNYDEDPARKTAPEINESFLGWLSKKDPQRPFFAFINYFDGHEPYLPRPPFDAKFGPRVHRVNPRHANYWNWTASEIQAEIDAYDGAIAALDQEIGKLLDELKKRDVLENTLIIITSDHGEEFGEHGIMDHGYSLYRPLLHVPLVVSFPNRVPAGRSINAAVSLRDLPATVLELLELKNNSGFPGRTLTRFWHAGGIALENPSTEPLLSELDSTPNLPATYPISRGDLKSLITTRYHYIRNGDGLEELYDLEDDPGEQKNLVNTEQGGQVLPQFRKSLEIIIARNQSRQ